jgi:plastocyanin
MRKFIGTLISAAALTLASCGSSPNSVNGCDAATAEDHTSESEVMIMFGDSMGNMYSPACVKMKAGSGVMFMGDLASMPIAGGTDGVVDAASPIKETNTGMSVEFTKLAAGTYGFFSSAHAGMEGALFVE